MLVPPNTGSGEDDPHFMITSGSTGEHICFDVNGNTGDVLHLLDDKTSGIISVITAIYICETIEYAHHIGKLIDCPI